MTSCVLECFLLSLTLLILFCVQESWQLLSGGQGSEDEARLLHDLFDAKGYNPLIRPVRNINETIQVNFSLALSQLINIDEKNQIMKANVWLQLYWNDYQLQWDPVQYGNIGAIRLPSHTIWTPDIVLFNNADGKYEVSYLCNCVIYANGDINWIPPAIYLTACQVDAKYFPFDQQECDMKFGSWTYSGDQLTFRWHKGKDAVVLDDYLRSGTWDIIQCRGNIVEKEEIFGRNEKQLNILVIYKFILRRKTLFYIINIIIPCILISFLSVCVFVLPADTSEKITLCISVLVTLVVFMLLVSKILPPSLTIPLISKYLLFTFILNVIAIVITVIVINRNYRTPHTHPLPNWIRVVFLDYLPRYLRMSRPNREDRRQTKDTFDSKHTSMGDMSYSHSTAVSSHADIHELSNTHQSKRLLGIQTSPYEYESNMEDAMDGPYVLTPELSRVAKSVNFIATLLKEADKYDSVLDDWKYVALVMDRLLLYIFLVVTVGGTIGILLTAPNIFDIVDQDLLLQRQMGVNAADV